MQKYRNGPYLLSYTYTSKYAQNYEKECLYRTTYKAPLLNTRETITKTSTMYL